MITRYSVISTDPVHECEGQRHAGEVPEKVPRAEGASGAQVEELLAEAPAAGAPNFILERLERLRLMIQMLSDVEWRLPHTDASRVLSALAYFAEPEDLIPDSIPGLGFLDDAIMIELVVRELKHEVEAYQDFREYRERMKKNGGESSRTDWLDTRRKELQDRMHRRRGRRSRLLR